MRMCMYVRMYAGVCVCANLEVSLMICAYILVFESRSLTFREEVPWPVVPRDPLIPVSAALGFMCTLLAKPSSQHLAMFVHYFY